MALMSSLLTELKPPTWTDECYTNKIYVQVPLNEDSEEYNEILSEYKIKYNNPVVSINRIQHPFAFCRFKLRQWHLFRFTGSLPKEERRFVDLHNDNNVNNFLQYNCDTRRDTFYFNDNSKYVVVAKTFYGYDFNERDSHHFPEYLIEYEIQSERNNDISLLGDMLNRLDI